PKGTILLHKSVAKRAEEVLCPVPHVCRALQTWEPTRSHEPCGARSKQKPSPSYSAARSRKLNNRVLAEQVMDNELAMDAKSGWLTVLRLVWIAGGVVAVNEPGPDVQITAGMAGRSLSRLSINTYGDLFAALMARGFPTLGAIFVVSPDKLQGLQRPDFRAISPTKQCLPWEVQQRWGQI